MLDQDQARIHISPEIGFLERTETHCPIEVAGLSIFLILPGGSQRLDLQVLYLPCLDRGLGVANESTTHASSMVILPDRHHMDFSREFIMLVERQETDNTVGTFGNNRLHCFQVSSILED